MVFARSPSASGSWYGDDVALIGMGPVSAVLRAEQLSYEAPAPFAMTAQRYTAGARIRVIDRLSAEIALVHHTHQLPQRRPTALDVGLTYSLRRD